MLLRPVVLAALLCLAACAEPRPTSSIGQPLRTAETPDERLYITCVSRDPFFTSKPCRDVNARLGTRRGR